MRAGGGAAAELGSIMSRMPIFSSPFLLGFEGLEQVLDRVTKTSGDGYPPYNIERFPAAPDGSEKFRITLAVAGFAREELDIAVEDRQLHVRGKQNDSGQRDFLHKGIANRHFARAFVLADGMDVTVARLENGLLAIDLVKSPPDRVVRRIEISE
jgi:HSP20 family molecular chaperone IbpA